MSKPNENKDTGSGGHTTLSARTGVRLTIPELCSIVVFAALAWGYLNNRFGRIESRIDRVEERLPGAQPQASRQPTLEDHYAGGTGSQQQP